MDIQGLGLQYSSIGKQQKTLTDEQKSQLQDILAQFDSENFSNEDKKSLGDLMKEAGIPRSRETAQALADAGFGTTKQQDTTDLSAYGNSNDLGSISSQFWQLIQQHRAGDITEDDFKTKIQQLTQTYFSNSSSGLLFDQKV